MFLLFVALIAGAQKAQNNRTILFVGAHPDDETAISEVLHKYARSGNKVFVIIATDGKDGTRVTKIPAGDSLGMLRKAESACGCEILGAEPPIFFGIERLDTKIGVGKYFKEHQRFRDSLKARIPAINPDIIITAGPDGDTHHSEHIVVGAAVTELLLAEGWVDKYPLYHFAWKKGIVSVDDGSYTDEQYFNVKISFTSEDEKKAIEALNCYVTQYTAAELTQEAANKLKDRSNTIYFRKFEVKKGIRNDF
ncbi:PIG-L family deacetylase [Terrimonas sp. NA20]|uniref:PIG-L family deacetylase n=1 Tax=Terrimonas ginsenosidimutans TaxID=2908004 RepID=A0ABS9KWR6_9BACT|nr:PIG-L family deacetylase [Terrimonas ginsenosidimutans]MCG2616766.1 PIG-L family deacetylase [Terrimonas ginsenosidimutans]